MALSVCNTEAPNSQHKTISILILEGSDSKDNLLAVMPLIVHQLADLGRTTWR